MASIVNRKGRYCVVYNYINQKGQRKQKWETYKTLAEAKARQKVVECKTEIGSFMEKISGRCPPTAEMLL